MASPRPPLLELLRWPSDTRTLLVLGAVLACAVASSSSAAAQVLGEADDRPAPALPGTKLAADGRSATPGAPLPGAALPPDGGAAATRAHLTGAVVTLGTPDPLALAELEVLDAGITTQADALGRFALELPSGAVVVRVRAPNHEPRDFDEALAPGARVEVRYRLRQRARPFETVVRGRRSDTEPPRVELSRAEAHEVAGTLGDPFRVVMLLPGVASVASGVSYPVVRGTQPAATGFFLDGLRLPQLFHLGVGSSVVHPEFIDRVDVFSGAIPAQYGRVLGGVIEGAVAKPRERLFATASVDVLNASAFVSAPFEAAGLSVSLAGRLSYTAPLATALARAVAPSTPENPHSEPVANLGDAQARVEWRLGRGRLRLLALTSFDEAGQRAAGAGTTTALLTSSFQRADLSWLGPVGPGSAQLGLSAGAERLGLLGERDGQRIGDFLLGKSDAVVHGRWSLAETGGLALVTGFEVSTLTSTLEVSRGATGPEGPAASFRAPRSTGGLGGAFLEASLTQQRLTLTVGARTDAYLLAPSTWLASVDPRLAARLALSDAFGLRASAGVLHQAPTVLVNLPVSDLAGLRDGLQSAAHLELGADAWLPHGVEVSATAFFDPIFRSVEYSLESFLWNRPRLEGADIGLPGRAGGLEVLVRKRPTGAWFGWVAATLLRSERLRTVALYDGQGDVTGTDRRWVAFAFDQTVVLNATLGVRLPRGFSLGAGLHVNTGRPESGVLSTRAMEPGVAPGSLSPAWVPASLAKETRLPPFWRLDVRGSKTWTLDAWTLELYLDVLNASLSSEVFGYSYSVAAAPSGDARLDKKAWEIPLILPFLGLKGTY